MNRQILMERIHGVEREHRVAALSVATLRVDAGRDPTLLPANELKPRDVEACQGNLEATYLVRLFAEFEAPLRLYWRDVRRKRRTWQTIGAHDLIEAVGAYRRVSGLLRREVQRIRELRNAIVHGPRIGRPTEIALRVCGSSLRRFLSHFPLQW